MIRRDVAGARIARASAWLADAERTFALPVEQFVAATRERDLALFSYGGEHGLGMPRSF